MKIYFRVDSSYEIGTGHVMRCLVLAKKISNLSGATCVFVCRDHPGACLSLIEDSGFKVLLLPKNNLDIKFDSVYEYWLSVPQIEDAKETIRCIENDAPEGCDLVVVDHYGIDFVWESKVKAVSKRILAIDDLANRKHEVEYLLDQNFAPNFKHRYSGLVPLDCELFLGMEYALLRDEFLKARLSVNQRQNMNNLLLFFGGVDKLNITEQVVDILDDMLSLFSNVTVVVGKQYPYIEILRKKCARYKNLSLLIQVENMAELMSQADIAIGAGGATTIERIFLGLPSIVITVADNQVEVTRHLANNNLVHYVGHYDEDISVNIRGKIKEYFDSPSKLAHVSNELLKFTHHKLAVMVKHILNQIMEVRKT